jgi:hypothetical protein
MAIVSTYGGNDGVAASGGFEEVTINGAVIKPGGQGTRLDCAPCGRWGEKTREAKIS